MTAVKYSSYINQYLLERQIEVLFPNEQTYVDSKRLLHIKYPFSGKHLELDVWIPKKHLGFEFQDLYHYITTWYAQNTLEHIQYKDSIKKSSINRMGITLVAVPCWWDGTQESLVATVNFERPDVIPSLQSMPISLNPPQDYFPKVDVPGVGELMLASFPRDLDFDLAEIDNSWWMGEKYDGVRCCWNPSTSRVYSRSGKKVPIHLSFKRKLPNIFLDGEIWFGRGAFSLASMLFAGSEELISWHVARMIFFDSPDKKLHNTPFEKRFENVLLGIEHDDPCSIVTTRIMCQDSVQVNMFVGGVIENGGEGMIARKVGSLYLHGRNASLIKLKTAYADKEALVVGLDYDSVVLKIPSGETFSVPYDDVLTPTTPIKGEIVTFSYELGLRREFPAKPKICKLRSDLNWEDVVANYTKDKKHLNHFSQIKIGSANFSDSAAGPLHPSHAKNISQSEGHTQSQKDAKVLITWNDVANRRKFFENYAREMCFDPLIATNWYSQRMENILSFNGAARVLHYHQNSASRALLDLFPDIGLDKNCLWPERVAQNTLAVHVKSKSIKVFEKYARENGFDPSNPASWLSQSKRKILANKSIARIVSLYYKGKVTKALSDLFPSFASTKPKWAAVRSEDPYRYQNSRRKFFEKYAKDNGFDPLDPKNWYIQSRAKIVSFKGAQRVISYHGGKVATALRELFPEIGVDETKFSWNKTAKHRNFFKSYAAEQGFEYLNPENWYRHREKILSIKGTANIIQHHQYSLAQTLIDLFPNIAFDKSQLRNGPIWPDRDTRKKFFMNYATTQGFDPYDTDPWYSQSKIRIWASKGGHMVDTFYKGSIPGALADLFPDLSFDITKFKHYSSVHGIR